MSIVIRPTAEEPGVASAVPTVRRLRSWADEARHEGRASAVTLPLDAARAVVHGTGKLRAPVDVLDAVIAARNAGRAAGWEQRDPLLLGALDGLVDKHENRYSYASYVGLPLLDVLIDGGSEFPAQLVAALLWDLEQFEAGSRLGLDARFPDLPGPLELTRRRIRAIRGARAAFTPERAAPAALARAFEDDLVASALDAGAALAGMDGVTRFVLDASVLPMSTVHDEYLFLRVLQCFEVLFARCLRDVTEARDLLFAGRCEACGAALGSASRHLRRYPSLCKVLTTMPPEHFHAFRDDTDGSSAIGSSRIKLFEALCRRISDTELGTAPFTAVTDVRSRCAAGLLTLEDAWRHVQGERPPAALDVVASALLELERQYDGWRSMHLAIVRRWLGRVPGTGGTAGAAYLERRRHQRLVPYVPRATGVA